MVESGRDQQPSDSAADQPDDERVVVAGLDEGRPAGGASEASEADAADQERPVVARAVQHRPTSDIEVSEADALDQAREVPLDEDLDR